MNQHLLDARSDKKERRMQVAEIRANILNSNKLAAAQEEIRDLRELLQKQKREFLYRNRCFSDVLNDLIDHDTSTNDINDYKEKTINLALQIKYLSPKAYALLCNELPFPSISIIEKNYQKRISDIPDQLTNINSIGELVNLWKEKHEISKSEHKFGLSRVKCKNIRTLTRFIRVISEAQAISCEQTYQQLCSLNDDIEDVRGRVFTHNAIVDMFVLFQIHYIGSICQ